MGEIVVVPAYLALSDGAVFEGQSVGYLGETVGELVFHTAMTGYQEILTDPSFAQQIIMFTCPHVGNVGTCVEDMESKQVHASAAVMHSMTENAQHWRSEQSLPDFLKAQKVVGISGIDTRALTNRLRDQGAVGACVIAGEGDPASLKAKAIEKAKSFKGLSGVDLASVVSTEQPYQWDQGLAGKSPEKTNGHHVAVMDFGVKHQMLRLLVDQGCQVTVVPAQMTAESLLALKPKGVLLSNGPGDPAACEGMIRTITELIEAKVPLFGICLGHQLLALALGAKTKKMAFGHHGGNHPVMDLTMQKAMITSQNHGFVVDDATLPESMEVSQRSMFDGTMQGFVHKTLPIMSIQGHPEASPGPHDWREHFERFARMMEAYHA